MKERLCSGQWKYEEGNSRDVDSAAMAFGEGALKSQESDAQFLVLCFVVKKTVDRYMQWEKVGFMWIVKYWQWVVRK